MRYNIHGRLIYDAMDGTLTLPGSDEADSQLSITANALLWFFLRHTEVVSRDEVLKKVWDDNGLTSSNSNLNQYLSMLRKTFRHYDIDNIIVTVSRGLLQLNPDLTIERLDASPEPEQPPAAEAEPDPAAVPEEQKTVSSRHAARYLLVSRRRLPAHHRPAAGGLQFSRRQHIAPHHPDANAPQPVRAAGQR